MKAFKTIVLFYLMIASDSNSFCWMRSLCLSLFQVIELNQTFSLKSRSSRGWYKSLFGLPWTSCQDLVWHFCLRCLAYSEPASMAFVCWRHSLAYWVLANSFIPLSSLSQLTDCAKHLSKFSIHRVLDPSRTNHKTPTFPNLSKILCLMR